VSETMVFVLAIVALQIIVGRYNCEDVTFFSIVSRLCLLPHRHHDGHSVSAAPARPFVDLRPPHTVRPLSSSPPRLCRLALTPRVQVYGTAA